MEVFAYMGGASLNLKGVTANRIRAYAFLPRELDDVGIVVNQPPSRPWHYHRKGAPR